MAPGMSKQDNTIPSILHSYMYCSYSPEAVRTICASALLTSPDPAPPMAAANKLLALFVLAPILLLPALAAIIADWRRFCCDCRCCCCSAAMRRALAWLPSWPPLEWDPPSRRARPATAARLALPGLKLVGGRSHGGLGGRPL